MIALQGCSPAAGARAYRAAPPIVVLLREHQPVIVLRAAVPPDALVRLQQVDRHARDRDRPQTAVLGRTEGGVWSAFRELRLEGSRAPNRDRRAPTRARTALTSACPSRA